MGNQIATDGGGDAGADDLKKPYGEAREEGRNVASHGHPRRAFSSNSPVAAQIQKSLWGEIEIALFP